MLHQLHISGLGVIDDLDLELHAGLNVLTGETGAGKTMVTVGLALVLGARASATLVREGGSAARVQARFDAPPQAKDWAEGGEVVLARSVATEGRSTARIGGELVPVSALADLAPALVEIHGQHQGTRLLSPAAQSAFLDRSAGGPHLEAVAALAAEHERLRAARRDLERLREEGRDRERELDLLAYQIREIEAAAPRPGETAELQAEESRLANAERLLERTSMAERSLGEEGGASDTLATAAAQLRTVSEVDADARELAARVEDLSTAAAELARDVRAYRERVEVDPARLEAVGERIAALKALGRKYGETEDEVLGFLEDARRRADAIATVSHGLSELEASVADASERVSALALAVSQGRAEAAPRLSEAVGEELRALGMPQAHVEVALEPAGELGPGGAERVVFLLSAGSGQPLGPLAKVASGGELSRAMLACRSVLVDLDDVPTLVFDEVDAGIGGRAGLAVGRRLAALARDRQVLVVTHLPQIASFADLHIRVDKTGGAATVSPLDDAGRIEELTRMLAGMPGSEAAATHAEELLAQAGEARGDRDRRGSGSRRGSGRPARATR